MVAVSLKNTIAQARAYARDPEHEVENPVYVLLAELPEETVNLLTGDTLVVKFDDETFVANLTVSTTVSGKSVTHEDATEGGVTTRTYSLEDSGVEPIAVTIGGDTDNPLPAGTEPITVDATDGFTLRFAAKQTGVTYILQSAATVDGAFADVTVNGTPVSVTPQAVDDVVVLTDPDVQSTVKFFRVKVVVAP